MMKNISVRFRIYFSILVAVLFIGMVGLMVIEDFSRWMRFIFLS